MSDPYLTTHSFIHVCCILSLPASVARQNSRGDSAVENWSTALRGPSAVRARWLFLRTFFFFFYTIITSTERGASAVENLGSSRYWDRRNLSQLKNCCGGYKPSLKYSKIISFVIISLYKKYRSVGSGKHAVSGQQDRASLYYAFHIFENISFTVLWYLLLILHFPFLTNFLIYCLISLIFFINFSSSVITNSLLIFGRWQCVTPPIYEKMKYIHVIGRTVL